MGGGMNGWGKGGGKKTDWLGGGWEGAVEGKL